MALSIVELLQSVGPEHVFVQNVIENLTNARSRKDGQTAVTFVTGSHIFAPNDALADEPRYVGLVVWMPRERVEQARRDYAIRKSLQPKEA